MPSIRQILFMAPAMAAVAAAQGIITSAQGTKGSVASKSFQVKIGGTDANVINAAEISNNLVNGCGRTLDAGNIDIGTETENELAAKAVTSITKGAKVAVTISQGSSAGAGPYSCVLDSSSNAGLAENLTSTESTPKDSTGDINLEVTMPSNLNCTGASTGNVCTVKCVNNNAAGPFGGCFAVQQTDITPAVNVASTITTAATLAGVQNQILQGNQQLKVAVAANAQSSLADQAKNVVTALVKSVIPNSKVETTGVQQVASSASSGNANANAGAAAKGSAAKGSAAKGSAAKGSAAKGAAAKGAAAKGAAAAGKKNARMFVS